MTHVRSRGLDTGPATRGPRLVELDALRFVAAFAVMSFHYMAASKSLWGDYPTALFASVNRVTTLGILGVELFFLISGFVILMSAWGHSIGDFVVSRVSRLYPAYWFVVIALFVMYTFVGVKGFDPGLSLRDYLINLTMLQGGLGVGHAGAVFWSLWVELRFYILVGLFMLFGITLRRCLGFMTGWLILVVAAEATHNDVLTFLFMPRQAPYFIAGMAFYLIHRFGSTLVLWAFVAVSYGLCLLAATERVKGRVDMIGFEHFPAPPEGAIIAITLIFLLIAAVSLGWLRWLRWRALTTVGALTYPLYLVHQNVSAVLIPGLKDSVGRWPLVGLTMAVSIALAYLVYRLVDKPGQRWLRAALGASLDRIRLRGGRSGPPPPAEETHVATQSKEASVP
ncbi:acyltransferase [Microtetraspora sp. AC03309]|uniref:acyltransferase family protein n=1 Tax=Microtetraspora sp. AC03309 TaxID=2779376 RepID=UPI001E4FB84B|nr:acyltransferase [Microtetraspora sp. AC03309]